MKQILIPVYSLCECGCGHDRIVDIEECMIRELLDAQLKTETEIN